VRRDLLLFAGLFFRLFLVPGLGLLLILFLLLFLLRVLLFLFLVFLLLIALGLLILLVVLFLIVLLVLILLLLILVLLLLLVQQFIKLLEFLIFREALQPVGDDLERAGNVVGEKMLRATMKEFIGVLRACA
jgi:Wiskott-Aldrich syndrome protein